MSENRKNVNGKFIGKKMGILAAAALTATMIGGNMQAVTQPVRASQTQEAAGSVLPDNITIDQPTELSEVGLPVSEYGTLEWADGSYVPTKRVQSCEVILVPGEGQDLSHVDGWDPEAGVVAGYINVIVNNADDDSADKTEPEVTETPDEIPDITETPSKEEKDNKAETDQDIKESDTKKDSKADDKNSSKDDTKDSSEDKTADAEDKKDAAEDIVGKLEPADQDVNNSDDTDDSDSSDGADDNIFDNPVLPDQKDDRPTDADDNLTDAEKEERAELNHTCEGITVSGINLPWYVQFRVSSGDSYQFTNESDAMIFQSYEFELWDLQNNTEYEIPSGEYISVTVPVKAGYQYTIEHLLDNGATETIIPSVDNDVMVFSTHSFSPFGIAGSRQLVGPDGGDDSESTDTVTPTPTATSAQGTTTDSGNSNTVSMNNSSDNNLGSSNSSASAQTDDSAENESSKNNGAVNTGDTTTILPFVVLVVAAAVIIGAVVFIKKKKK